jgi:hypothetical protein
MNNNTNEEEKKPGQKWLVIKTGAGEITGYIEGFLARGGKYVTIPGASRWLDANDPAAASIIAGQK